MSIAKGMTMEQRLAEVILQGLPFTADDVTDSGTVTVDASHAPNGRQNSIGVLFNVAAKHGWIRFTGRVAKSAAPHRKGGMVRVWEPTLVGCRWARSVLGVPA